MKATVSIDWCSFTLRCEGYEDDHKERHSSTYDDVLYIIGEYLQLDPELFSPMEFGGRYGYRKGTAFNGIEIYYDGNSTTMGANVSMSGDGCGAYTQFHDKMKLLKRLYNGWKEGEINPTRLDIACDDHIGLLNIGRVIEYIRGSRLRSRITHKKAIISLNAADHDEGDTVYIGSEKSEMRIRIYDKAKEQGDYQGTWNRLEMVNRRDYARAVLEAIVTGTVSDGLSPGKTVLGEIIAGILVERIAFIERDDTNISRCSLASWWQEFLDTIERIKLMFKEKPEMKIEKLAQYFGMDLSAVVYVLSEAYGDDFWTTVKSRGKEKLRRRHMTMLEDWKRMAG